MATGRVRLIRFVATLSLCLAAWSWPLGALAQPADDAARSTARELANEGGKLYEEGRYAESLEKLDKAYAILQVPTLGYWSARSLEHVGRWVEASERYLSVTRLEAPTVGTELHAKAQADATAAREALLPKIPKLVVSVSGVAPESVTLTIDDKPIAVAMLDAPLPVDPGAHRVVVTSGAQRREKTVTLGEAGRERVVLLFEAPAPEEPSPRGAIPPPAAVSVPGTPPDRDKPRSVDSATGGEAIRTAGWVSLAVGGAAALTGIATGAVLLSKGGAVKDECLDGECRAGFADDETYNTLRPVTTVMLIVGAVGLGAGITLVLIASPSEPRVAPLLGPGSLGVRVRF